MNTGILDMLGDGILNHLPLVGYGIELYLLACGVTKEEIEKFRSIMLVEEK